MMVRTQNKQIYTKITGLLQDRIESWTLNRQGLVYPNSAGAHLLRKRVGLLLLQSKLFCSVVSQSLVIVCRIVHTGLCLLRPLDVADEIRIRIGDVNNVDGRIERASIALCFRQQAISSRFQVDCH